VPAERQLELPATTLAPACARAFLYDAWASEVGRDVLDAMGLCVSELVTNALDHAVPPYRVRLSSCDDRHRVEVDDATTDVVPVVQPQSESQPRGRGLFLVEQLANAWGVVFEDRHKTVWAEF